MNAKIKIKELAVNIKTAAVTSPGAFVLIALLGLTQLLYAHIPCAIDLNILFCFSIIFTASEFVKQAARKRKLVICILIALFIGAVYAFKLLTYSKRISLASTSLCVLYCWTALIVFFSPKQNYIIEFKLRFIHILVSLLFFAALYAAVFISVFFINAIFNLALDFEDSVVFRIANSSASVTGSLVFMSYKTKTERLHSKLFTLMFRDILSFLLPILCALGLVYMAKFIIFPASGDRLGLDEWYYLIYAALILCILMMQNFDSVHKRARLISFVLALAPLLFIAASMRVRALNTDRWFSPGFTRKNERFIHEIILNAVLSLFFMYAVFRDKKITIKLNAAIAAAGFVLFFPVIGYHNYNAYKKLEPESLKKERNNLEQFMYKKKKSTEPAKISIYQRYTADFSPLKNVDSIIDTAAYSHILFGIELSIDLDPNHRLPVQYEKRTQEITYKNYNFRIAGDGKTLHILNSATGERNAIDVYEKAKTDYETKRTQKDLPDHEKVQLPTKPVFEFENEDIKLYISMYHYREDDYAKLRFNVYVKAAAMGGL